MLLAPCSSTAIIWQDARISYSDLLKHAAHYASLFSPESTRKIAIFSENRPEWTYALYAGWKNNAIVVPVDFMATADEVAYMLNDCRPEVIFCSKGTLDVFSKARESLTYEITLHLFDTVPEMPDHLDVEPVTYDDAEKTSLIIYTSGTTGSPKGVMLTFDNVMANVEAVSRDIPIFTRERTVLALLPFHHIFPLMGTLVAPLCVGAPVAFAPSMISEDIISTLQNNRVAIIIGVPRLYAAIRKGIMDKINSHGITRMLFKLAAAINSPGFSRALFKKVHQKFGGNVDYMVSGGAKLDEQVARDFKVLGFEMLEGFGMTEAAPMITFTRPGKWKIGSAGQAMPCLEVESRENEIVARGRNIMKGYYNRPEETAEVLRNGWLHTGDTGYLDDEGFIHVTGRLKEILVLSNGKNINPEEVEHKIMAVSDLITEVGVFMKDDLLQAAILPDFKKMSERGVVNIEDTIRWEVIDLYNRGTSPYKKISRFILIKEELPKTRLGKIQRFRLVQMTEQIVSGKKPEKAEPDMEEYRVIKNYLKEQKSADVRPDDHLEIDLGMDSLDKLGLLTFLESTFGIDLKEDVLISHPTIERLSNFMKEKKKRLTIETVKWAEIFREKVDLTLPRSWFTQNLFKNVSRYFLRLYFRLKGEGVENIPDGPFILAPNHQSFIDGLFVSVFLKNRIMKNTYFYAKEKHLRNRLVRAFANRNNVIIMDINRDLKQSLQKLAAVLRKGKNIIIFPEGTRTQTGEIGPFKKAFAILSRELNVPIVPVSIKGAFEALPKGSKIPRPWKKINIKFHKPVYPEQEDYDVLTERVFRLLSAELG